MVQDHGVAGRIAPSPAIGVTAATAVPPDTAKAETAEHAASPHAANTTATASIVSGGAIGSRMP